MPTHPNAGVLTRLLPRFNRHDHTAMAGCYDENATFSDIAFDLNGRKQIHAMWHMICEGDIQTRFEIVKSTSGEPLPTSWTITRSGRKAGRSTISFSRVSVLRTDE